MNPVHRFSVELAGCALDATHIERLCARYEGALQSGITSDWELFYRSLYGSMLEVSQTARGSVNEAMLRSVLQILEDDLGLRLFGCDAVAMLRSRFEQRARPKAALVS